MKKTLFIAVALFCQLSHADTNFAVRISCDFQQQAGAAELPDLTLLQGSAPMIQVAPMRMGRAVAADSLTTCQLVFAPSATSTYYVATNAYLATNSAYFIQLGTIGTNSVPTGSNSPAAWWYSVLFYRNGGIYWSGSGRLYIKRTTATGTNGLVWQAWAAGAAKDDLAREWIVDLSNEVASIEGIGVTYGTATNTAYRGDMGHAVSNLARIAYGWGNHATNSYMRTNGPGWQFAEDDIKLTGINGSVVFDVSGGEITGNGGDYKIRIDDGDVYGPWNFVDSLKVRNARLLFESTLESAGAAYTSPVPAGATFTNSGDYVQTPGLARGATRIAIRTTNAYGRSRGMLAFTHDANTIATLLPACNGSDEYLDFPFILNPTNDGIFVTYTEIPDILASAPPIITSFRVWTMADTNHVGRRLDTANAIYEGDYPTLPRQWANKTYADDQADAALALAVDEIETATFNRDLSGFVQRWNPRFDTFAYSNSMATLYGGSVATRLDGEGAAVIPQIKGFSVAAGEVATLTVWSYSGGATNLVPETSTNLVDWTRVPESIVSATNVDMYTAQVVFTNAAAQALFVRLVDVSGGSGVPVFRVYGGIAFGDNDPITEWPVGGDGSGITASTATNIALAVLAASTNANDGAARASIVAIGAVASNATTAAQAGAIASNVVAEMVGSPGPVLAEGVPQALALADGFVTIWSTGLWEQAYTAAGAATVRVVKANATNSAALILHATLSSHPTFFETNNLLGFSTTGLSTNGGTTTVSLRSKPGSTNWTWSIDLP